jgi:hypothetical protein
MLKHAAIMADIDARIRNHTSNSGSIETPTANIEKIVPTNPVPCEAILLSGVFIVRVLDMLQ